MFKFTKKMYTDLTFVVVCSYIHDYTVESQKMATCNFLSLEEVLPIMHYNIPTMHWQRKSFTFKVSVNRLHFQSECPPPGSVSIHPGSAR